MKRVALKLRGWLWVLGLSVGVLALFLAPWVIRELRPATSESVFQEARAQLGMLRHESQIIAAAGELVYGWVRAGDLSTAKEFVERLPTKVKPYVQHQLVLALIDGERLDDALREAPHLLTTNYGSVYDAPAPTRRDLFVRLAYELINAQRYDDALRVVEWIEQVDEDDTHLFCYVYLADAAADAGRLEVAEKAMTALRDVYFERSVGAFLLVKGWLNHNQSHKALEWLRNHLKDPEWYPIRMSEPLPDSLQAVVDRVARLVRQGRIQEAAQQAEQVLRNYLLSHTQSNADFDLLVHLSARFSETLPPATMRALLRRLPVGRYQCAESHLNEGYLYGLARAGRWQEVRREIKLKNGLIAEPEQKLWLAVAALAQNRNDLAKQMGIDLSARNLSPSTALLVAYYLLEQGQTQLAKESVNRVTVPPIPVRVRQEVQNLLSATSVRSDAILQAIQELALHEPYLWSKIGHSPQIRIVGQTPNSLLNFFRGDCRISAGRAVLCANRRVYPAILTLLNEGFLSDGATEWSLPRAMLWQDDYDPSLAEWLLNSPDGDRFCFAYGAAAAAQAGRFEDAERLMRKVGGISRGWYDTYRRGYAVGLAKQGEFRAALWEARRIRSDTLRIGALARIAAEMRRQGL